MSELRVIDHTGDSKLVWDADKDAEVQAAREMYDGLKKKGYAAFGVKKDGEKGKILTEFDPEAEKIIMVPPARGG